MTANQIAYQVAQENARANRAREAENTRSNIARETETKRSNLVNEDLAAEDLAEKARHNRNQEAIGIGKVAVDAIKIF